MNPSVSRWDLSPQGYGLAWRFGYFVRAQVARGGQARGIGFQDDYLSALESLAGVRRVVQTKLELDSILIGSLREASTVYGQAREFGFP